MGQKNVNFVIVAVMINMEKKFIKFLAENKTYRQYMYNLAYVPGNSWTWADYRDTTEESDWILSAFVFEDSPEGYDFWEELAIKWHKLL